jgi:hypothetical protein
VANRVRHLTSPTEPGHIGTVLCGAVNKSPIYGFLKQTRDLVRVTCKRCEAEMTRRHKAQRPLTGHHACPYCPSHG